MKKQKTLFEHLGEFLPSETWSEVELELELGRISADAMRIADESGLTRRELAKRMGLSSPSTVQRIVGGAEAYNVTVETLLRFARACGHHLRISFVPTTRRWKAPEFEVIDGGAEPAEPPPSDPTLLAA